MADSEDADKGTRTLILHAYVQFQATNLALSRTWVLYSDFNRNSEGTKVEAQYSSHLSEKTEAVAELPITQKTCIGFCVL